MTRPGSGVAMGVRVGVPAWRRNGSPALEESAGVRVPRWDESHGVSGLSHGEIFLSEESAASRDPGVLRDESHSSWDSHDEYLHCEESA